MILQVLNPDNYHLNGYALPMVGVGAAIAALGLFVLIRERGARIGVLFLLLCLSVSLYLVATGLNYASRDDGLSLVWIRISQLGSVFIPSTVLLLTTARLGLFHRFRFTVAASIVLSTLFALGVFFTDLQVRGSARFFWGNFVQYGPLGFVFIGFFISIMVFILHLYWREYRRSTTERHKKRFRGLLIAFSVAYVGAVDFLPTLGFPVYPFGYVPIFFFVVISAYIVMRYHLVDITPEMAAGQILETMQGAVIVVDLEGKIWVVNRVAQEILGHNKSELIGKGITSILPVPAAFSATVRTGERSAGREMVWPGGHGKQFDVSVTTSPLMDQHNVPVGTVYVAHDITERKQAEELLKESLSLKRATLDSTADGILVVNSQAKVVDYNSKFTELWNIPPELMEQKDDGRLLQHVLGQLKYPEAFANKVRELYNNPDADDFDEIPFTDGRIFERYSTPHRLEGKSVGRVWSFRDVTERKQAEARLKCYSEELVEINEELKSFAYIVSHDLRAPLVNIKGFSQELDRSLREIELCVEKHLPMLEEAEKERITPILKKDIPEALKFIGSSVNRMDNLINAILKLSRAGRRKLVPEPVSVYDLVQNILRSFAHQIGTRHICVAVNELPDIVADRTALEQIFGNLIDNAVKYLEPGRNGELELSAEKNDGEVIFHVRDNGRGMEKEDIPKAFEIFRRVGRQDVPGEGMGLSYVKTLVRLLGGRIWCESEIDNGTTFSFALPQRGA